MRPVPRAAPPRMLFAAVVLAVAAAFSAAPAQADCTANLQGVVVTDNASHGQTNACPLRVGRPEGTGTGRKVG
jgi:hypothetical protein